MDSRGQTTFEYLLLVGGVVILATLVVYMLYSGGKSSAEQVNKTVGSASGTLVKEANEFIQNISNI